MEQVVVKLITSYFANTTLNQPVALAVEKSHQCEAGFADDVPATLDTCNRVSTARS